MWTNRNHNATFAAICYKSHINSMFVNMNFVGFACPPIYEKQSVVQVSIFWNAQDARSVSVFMMFKRLWAKISLINYVTYKSRGIYKRTLNTMDARVQIVRIFSWLKNLKLKKAMSVIFVESGTASSAKNLIKVTTATSGSLRWMTQAWKN